MERLKTILPQVSDTGHLSKEEQRSQAVLAPPRAGLPHPPGLQK